VLAGQEDALEVEVDLSRNASSAHLHRPPGGRAADVVHQDVDAAVARDRVRDQRATAALSVTSQASPFEAPALLGDALGGLGIESGARSTPITTRALAARGPPRWRARCPSQARRSRRR
jgi:hypothetical protein